MTTLYLTEPGLVVRCQNEILEVHGRQLTRTCRLSELSLVVIMPGVQLTSGAIAKLLDEGIETLFLRQNGQFRGRLQSHFPTNPAIRIAQYQLIETTFGMEIAHRFVEGKVRNQRLVLQRRNRETKGRISELAEAIERISAYIAPLRTSSSGRDRDTLMGIEGICARIYYQGLRHWMPPEWGFVGRNRQPPLDPVNAMLSWGYGVLLARVFAACVQAGLDPYLGFFHAVQPYRPNLVLDVMEEFRPVVVDRAVIALVRSLTISQEDFEPSPDGEGIWLGMTAKRLLLEHLEQQLNTPLLYPSQGRRLKVSDILLEQARSLARCIVERSLTYEPFLLK
jgi:CRISP-associated protein Cas1